MNDQNNIGWLKIATTQKIHDDFKMMCWIEDTTMTSKIAQLIAQEVAKNEPEIKETRKTKRLMQYDIMKKNS